MLLNGLKNEKEKLKTMMELERLVREGILIRRVALVSWKNGKILAWYNSLLEAPEYFAHKGEKRELSLENFRIFYELKLPD